MEPLSNIKWYRNMWAEPPRESYEDLDWEDARMYRRKM